MESYIDCKKKLYNTIKEFLEESEKKNQESFEEFCDNMKNFHIEGDREEMTQFLLIIKGISDNHHRDINFNQKINQILHHYQEQIKQTLSNDEIFHIFENHKLIVLFLLQSKIISISDFIYNDIINKIESNGNRYCHFFYPELEEFKGEEEMKSIKNELLFLNSTAFDNYEEKRQEGENDSHICSLIRNDSVKEFISYVNRNNISVFSEIKPSIFETNLFLIENDQTSLIEYSAFFGSIQIFQYLLMNNAELTPSLWNYSIHSRNAELIHLLESNEIKPPELKNLLLRPKIMNKNNSSEKEEEKEEKNEKESYLSCLIESIKCHHTEFTEYIENNLMLEQEIESPETKKIFFLNTIKYYNYSYFQIDKIEEQEFFYLCLYKYNMLVELLLKSKEEEIKGKIISLPNN